MSYILLSYVSLLFRNFFGEIHGEIFFLNIKLTISETSTEILRKYFFLTFSEMGNNLGKFGFL